MPAPTTRRRVPLPRIGRLSTSPAKSAARRTRQKGRAAAAALTSKARSAVRLPRRKRRRSSRYGRPSSCSDTDEQGENGERDWESQAGSEDEVESADELNVIATGDADPHDPSLFERRRSSARRSKTATKEDDDDDDGDTGSASDAFVHTTEASEVDGDDDQDGDYLESSKRSLRPQRHQHRPNDRRRPAQGANNVLSPIPTNLQQYHMNHIGLTAHGPDVEPAKKGVKRKRSAPMVVVAVAGRSNSNRAETAAGRMTAQRRVAPAAAADHFVAHPHAGVLTRRQSRDVVTRPAPNGRAGGPAPARSVSSQGSRRSIDKGKAKATEASEDESGVDDARREEGRASPRRARRAKASRRVADSDGWGRDSAVGDQVVNEDHANSMPSLVAVEEGLDRNDDFYLHRCMEWELHRLRKAELFRLHFVAGTWAEGENVDANLYTKQELIEGILAARFRNSRDDSPSSIETAPRKGEEGYSDSASSRHSSPVRHTPRRPRHNGQQRSRHRRPSTSGSSSDEMAHDWGADHETDVANQAEGEETEAENTQNADRRVAARRERLAPNGHVSRKQATNGVILAAPSPGLSRFTRGRSRSILERRHALKFRSPALADHREDVGEVENKKVANGTVGSSPLASASSAASRVSPIATRLRRADKASTELNRTTGLSSFHPSRRARGRARASNEPPSPSSGAADLEDHELSEPDGQALKAGPSPKAPGWSRKVQRHVAFQGSDEESDDRSSTGEEDGKTEGNVMLSGDRQGDEGDVDMDEADVRRRNPFATRATPSRKAKQRAKETMQVDSTTDDDNGREVDDYEEEKEKEEGEEEDVDEVGETDDGGGPATQVARRRRGRPTKKLTARTAALTIQSDAEEDADMAKEPQTKLTRGKSIARTVRRTRSSNEAPRSAKGDAREAESALTSARAQRNGKMLAAAQDEIQDMEMAAVDDAVDFANETKKTLLRFRRDKLLELCAARGLEREGTKTELAQALLDWRDSHADDSADSDATAKPASSRDSSNQQEAARGKARTTKGRSRHSSPRPLLLRTEQPEAAEQPAPATPRQGSQEKETEVPAEDINTLDLEALNLQDKEIPPDRLEKLEKIGSGGFKDVYIGKYAMTRARKIKVAIADIRGHLTDMDIKELSLLRDLQHDNIVRFIGVSIPEAPRDVPCMIVSELCSNGDLFDYIRNVPPPSDDKIFKILLECARGLHYLHMRKPAIIHRDCKSTNVLITGRGIAKINDFGLARVKNSTRSMVRSLVGTVNWQAVELWVPQPRYNEKVDVYSAAMTFWETLQWHEKEKIYPFQGMNEHAIFEYAGVKQLRPDVKPIRRRFGQGIVTLLERMWAQDPRDRPTMEEVCTELEALIKVKKESK